MVTFEETINNNASENEHLRKLVNRLSDEALCTPLTAGWIISAVLAHLAFWDQRAIILIEKWKKEGISPSPIDLDVINDASRRLCLAIEPRKAAELAIALADEIDQDIVNLSPEMAEAIATKGVTVRLNRADHRRTHLNEIEKALQEKGS
ncbi:MAG: maleylpyruvate isomerase N-terminal domain-containing protein [Chloroflexota bacterium]